MKTNSEIVIENIANRRTIKPESCVEASIPNEDIWRILDCANWAPTHGYTEPWRFVVFTGEAKHRFAKDHAEMYKSQTAPENFKQVSYDKLINRVKYTSHIIAYANKRGINPKIPEIEELQATAMAVQNIQLVASSLGYAAYIHSGGMTFSNSMKAYLDFKEEDKVLGFIYIGIPRDEERTPGRRITSIQDKVVWKG
jgi:nitroreductase